MDPVDLDQLLDDFEENEDLLDSRGTSQIPNPVAFNSQPPLAYRNGDNMISPIHQQSDCHTELPAKTTQNSKNSFGYLNPNLSSNSSDQAGGMNGSRDSYNQAELINPFLSIQKEEPEKISHQSAINPDMTLTSSSNMAPPVSYTLPNNCVSHHVIHESSVGILPGTDFASSAAGAGAETQNENVTYQSHPDSNNLPLNNTSNIGQLLPNHETSPQDGIIHRLVNNTGMDVSLSQLNSSTLMEPTSIIKNEDITVAGHSEIPRGNYMTELSEHLVSNAPSEQTGLSDTFENNGFISAGHESMPPLERDIHLEKETISPLDKPNGDISGFMGHLQSDRVDKGHCKEEQASLAPTVATHIDSSENNKMDIKDTCLHSDPSKHSILGVENSGVSLSDQESVTPATMGDSVEVQQIREGPSENCANVITVGGKKELSDRASERVTDVSSTIPQDEPKSFVEIGKLTEKAATTETLPGNTTLDNTFFGEQAGPVNQAITLPQLNTVENTQIFQQSLRQDITNEQQNGFISEGHNSETVTKSLSAIPSFGLSSPESSGKLENEHFDKVQENANVDFVAQNNIPGQQSNETDKQNKDSPNTIDLSLPHHGSETTSEGVHSEFEGAMLDEVIKAKQETTVFLPNTLRSDLPSQLSEAKPVSSNAVPRESVQDIGPMAPVSQEGEKSAIDHPVIDNSKPMLTNTAPVAVDSKEDTSTDLAIDFSQLEAEAFSELENIEANMDIGSHPVLQVLDDHKGLDSGCSSLETPTNPSENQLPTPTQDLAQGNPDIETRLPEGAQEDKGIPNTDTPQNSLAHNDQSPESQNTGGNLSPTTSLNPYYLASLQRPGIIPSSRQEGVENRNVVPQLSVQPADCPPDAAEELATEATEGVEPGAPAMEGDDLPEQASVPDEQPGEDGMGASGGSLDTPTQPQTRRNDELEAPPGLIFPREGSLDPPPSTSYPAISIAALGTVQPLWMPDSDTQVCLQCDLRFSFTKRRHHCRACGKIFCSTCCNMKSKLHYMGDKEARVCSVCYQDLIRAQVYKLMERPANTLPSTEQAMASSMAAASAPWCDINDPPPAYSATAPPSALSRPTSERPVSATLEREPKQVTFRDGIRPGFSNVAGAVKKRKVSKTELQHLIPPDGLPPCVQSIEGTLETIRDTDEIVKQVSEGQKVSFMISRNLLVMTQLVSLDCCMNRSCLVFTSEGLSTVGQTEIVIVLETSPSDVIIPVDIFKQYQCFYEAALQGKVFNDLGYIECTNLSTGEQVQQASPFLGNPENAGFLLIAPTSQCLRKLVDTKDYLFAILLQKSEVPWAKAFPLRLMLRLGAEFKYYPCPLFSQQSRSPVFGDIGHTVMNMLIDFQSYSYTLPVVSDFTIEMKEDCTLLTLPRDRYQDFVKVLQCGSEHVFAMGASFNVRADSYLVSVQTPNGDYHTEAINIQNKVRKVTGATFVIFSGALKPSTPEVKCKTSIVEDGLMIQLLPNVLEEVKNAVLNRTDFTVQSTKNSVNEGTEELAIRWVDSQPQAGIRTLSPVDGRDLSQMERIQFSDFTDFYCDTKGLRLTEIYCEGDVSEPLAIVSLAESLAEAVCEALVPMLQELMKTGVLKLGLRTDTDNITYECGGNGQRLPDFCTEYLDNKLIPVIHSAASRRRTPSVILQLIFHIVNL